jgi:hypothetical protein
MRDFCSSGTKTLNATKETRDPNANTYGGPAVIALYPF